MPEKAIPEKAMPDRKPTEAAGIDAGRMRAQVIETVTDAAKVATEASLSAPPKPADAIPKIARRDPVPAMRSSAPAPQPVPVQPVPVQPVPVLPALVAEDVARIANDMATEAREAAVASTTLPTTRPETPPTNMEKIMTTAEELMSFQQGNFEAFIKSGQIWAAGLQDLSRHWAATAQAQIDETMGAVKALTSVKSLREAVELQSTLARSSVEKAVAEGGKLTDASFKLAEQTVAPIAARLTVAAERFGRSA